MTHFPKILALLLFFPPCALKTMSRRPDDGSKVSYSATAFLFSEICLRTKCNDPEDWEHRLSSLGQQAGSHCLEIMLLKDQVRTRKTTIVEALEMVTLTLWPRWFDHRAEAQKELGADAYLICENNLALTQFARSMPQEYYSRVENPDDPSNPLMYPTLSLAAYVAGMIQGVLEATGFPAKVTVQDDPYSPGGYSAVFRVEFDAKVLERERRRSQRQ